LGSVIKTCHGDDDECDSEDIHDEVLAITTALTVKQQPSLCDYLLTKCTTDQDKDSFEKLIKANTIVVLHERFLNLPVAIGPPLLDCLQKEIEETFKVNTLLVWFGFSDNNIDYRVIFHQMLYSLLTVI
jgi:hypothetical protein